MATQQGKTPPSSRKPVAVRRGAYRPADGNAVYDEPTHKPVDPPTLIVQVFRDATRKRWRRVLLALGAIGVILALIGHRFVGALFGSGPANASLETNERRDLVELGRRAADAELADMPPFFVEADDYKPAFATAPSGPMQERIGWVDPTEESAVETLNAHGSQLTGVVVDALHLADARGDLSQYPLEPALLAARRHKLRVLLRIDAARAGVSHPEEVTALGRDEASLARFAAEVARRVASAGAAGVALELGDDEADADGKARQAIMVAVKAALGGRTVAVAFGGGASAPVVERAAKVADLLLLHAHVEAGDASEPVPPAPQSWLRDTLALARTLVPQGKLVALLPTRAVTWTVSGNDIKTHSRDYEWDEIVTRARVAGLVPQWSRASGNLALVLPGAEGIGSSDLVDADFRAEEDATLLVWLVDGATFADQLAELHVQGLRSVGLDALGREDPRIWGVLASESGPRLDAPKRALSVIPRFKSDHFSITSVGDGIEQRVLSEERDGKAEVQLSQQGRVLSETYRALPASVTVVYRGRVPDRTVSFTFDDGPDPDYSPRVLDVLAREGVKATFFMVGSRVERDPEIVKRMVREGHEIANHSFSHIDVSKVSSRRAHFELNATNLLLQATTGRTTTLFRPPYRAADPQDPEDVLAVEIGQRNGMSTIASTVDPLDWYTEPDPSINAEKEHIDLPPLSQFADRGAELVRRVLADIDQKHRGVILLHDGGGDRSATVAALGPIIDALKEDGYRFVQVRDIFGDRPIDLVNPPVSFAGEQQLTRFVWIAGTWSIRAMQLFALAGMLLTVVRVASLILLTLIEMRREKQRRLRLAGKPILRRPVSVVIAAYNEEKVIERTISSVLASENVDVEVIVLDDGSKDRTGDLVASRFFSDKRVRLVRLQNGGKARALNKGFKLASHEIVVALDADTIFLENTIFELAQRFDDAKVAAVAGRAVVGNVNSTIARWQALEYVVGQAIERRAWHALGVVSVVPGAVGAWRRSAVLDAGCFPRDTLAEDTDLTLLLQARGFSVEYADQAVALTEAPETTRALIKQRYRWSFGVLQAIWKHRRAIRGRSKSSRTMGLLLLPTMLIAHLLVPLLAPASDLAACIALYLGFGKTLVPYAIASLVADLAITAFAMRLDKAPLSMAYDWLIQRAAYRWILFVSLVRALVEAVRGGAVGWGKLVRTGAVKRPAPGEIAA